MPNFYARIADAAARSADRPAIDMVGPDGLLRTTYRALMEESGAAAAWLAHTAHIVRGDRVAILAANDAHWIAAYLAAFRLGAIVVPLDTAYRARDVRTILTDSGARVIFTTRRFEPTVRAAIDGTTDAPLVSLLAEGWAGATAADAPAPAELADGDAAVILYTSGTTADPKGVVLTHANLDAERRGAFDVIHVTEADVVLGVLPLFHALAQMANLLLPLSVGASVVFLESVNSSTLLEALATRGITAFACVPQFFYLIHERVMREVGHRGAVARGVFRSTLRANAWLRERAGWNPGRRIFARVHHVLGPHMRILITGGSRVDPAIARDLYGLGFSLQNAYGLTETSGGATIVRAGDRFTTSVGQPFAGVEIRIAPRAAPNPGEATEDGEILIRGPIVMREYFHRPDATADALVHGWLHTGDLGWIDRDGRLFITGRLKEIIVLASGKNLYPEEIEAHYRQSPFIKELAVLGLTDPGAPAAERLHAVIVPDEAVLRERGITNVRELIRFELEGLSVQLPAHKRILSYDVSLDALPRTTTGKLKRGEIMRRAEARRTTEQVSREPTDAEREWLADTRRADVTRAMAERLHHATVLPDANLELDLGLDSMERVELLTFVEEREGRRMDAEGRAAIFSVRQLVDAVLRAPMSGAANTAPAANEGESGLAWDRLLAEPPDPGLAANLARPKLVRAVVLYVLVRAAGVAAAIFLGFRVRGREHLPAETPFIISPNHQTFLDGFFLCAALPFRVFHRLFVVGAAEFFETPFMAWLAHAVNIVPLDPDRHLVEAMRAAAAGLSMGKALILFPEGERSIDGAPKPFRKGAAILASHLDAPVVPVAVRGLFDLWPRGRGFNWRMLLPWRRRPVTIAFGPPLRVARGDYRDGTDRLSAEVASLYAKLPC